MRSIAKIGLVAGGYAVALAAATAAVAIYIAEAGGPDRDMSSGMAAFGDSLLFLAAFGIASAPPTGAALYFLRPYRRFWIGLPVVALAVAATGVLGLVDYLAQRSGATDILPGVWSPLAVLRILVAPFFAWGFLVSGILAPSRSPRIALLAATAIEASVFGDFAAGLAYERLLS